jgi:hypothetical protein
VNSATALEEESAYDSCVAVALNIFLYHRPKELGSTGRANVWTYDCNDKVPGPPQFDISISQVFF